MDWNRKLGEPELRAKRQDCKKEVGVIFRGALKTNPVFLAIWSNKSEGRIESRVDDI